MTPRSLSIALALTILALSVTTANAAGTMSITLMPHCTEEDRTKCPSFQAVDAEYIKTARLAAGDILDIDVVVKGPDFARVRSVRSWLQYDPSVLEARSIELTGELPSPIPGEQAIDKNSARVKIGGSTSDGLTKNDVSVARVTFRVLSTVADTVILFADYRPDGTGQTSVNGQATGATPNPLLSVQPPRLTVSLAATASTSSSTVSSSAVSMSSSAMSIGSSVSSTGQSASSLPSQTPGAQTSFSLLQVQNVRVTSRENVIFLGWSPLRSTGLAGYNVYYGTISGRYLQRRSVPATSTSLTLRDLEPGTTYFLALRAVNAEEQESAFSQEVSVTVGQPETATAPLTNIPSDDSAPKNPVSTRGGTSVKGDTGTTSVLLGIVLTSAALGTTLAFRRQLALTAHPARG